MSSQQFCICIVFLLLACITFTTTASLYPVPRQQHSRTNLFEDAVASFVHNSRIRDADTAAAVAAPNDDNTPRLWAVLVAGSSSWWNYRHQADICHAYQIMKRHGIPDSQIIVMMYDDIAFSSENPTPGMVINRPNGTDVYKGVLKDYTGEDVNAANFLNVLMGNSSGMSSIGSGKVLGSGPNDHVFVNFADHGAPGLLAFPDDVLYSQDLMQTLKSMATRNMFKKLLLYIEACEAGSMFEGLLPSNIEIMAATASNADESSFACYYDDARMTYLGDVFSVNWMENTDANDIETETVTNQISVVTVETNTSHVTTYGDTTIGQLDVGEFQGVLEGPPPSEAKNWRRATDDAVRSEDVPMHILARRLHHTKTSAERQKLASQLNTMQRKRLLLLSIVSRIVRDIDGMTNELSNTVLKSRQKLTNRECAKAATEKFRHQCFNFRTNEYALRMVPILVNACELGVNQQALLQSIERVCGNANLQLPTEVL